MGWRQIRKKDGLERKEFSFKRGGSSLWLGIVSFGFLRGRGA
jgi:hypothetical protein